MASNRCSDIYIITAKAFYLNQNWITVDGGDYISNYMDVITYSCSNIRLTMLKKEAYAVQSNWIVWWAGAIWIPLTKDQ